MSDSPETIWLEPACESESCYGRQWSAEALDDCVEEECGCKAIEYIRKDLHSAALIAAEHDRDLYAAVLAGAEYPLDMDWLRKNGIDGAFAVGREVKRRTVKLVAALEEAKAALAATAANK